MTALRDRGVQAALASALLFGAGVPAAKLLLGQADPVLLAGLLYGFSGLGLTLFRLVRRTPRPRLAPMDWWPLGGAILTGGVIAPVLLLWGLAHMPASGASLMLNLEGVATAMLAWFVFRENVDRRIAIGMVVIVAGAGLLTAQEAVRFGAMWPALAVVGACVCWGLDNNLTRKVALADATWLTSVKGLAAGAVNLMLALASGAAWPGPTTIAGAAAAGVLCYGLSLTLFIVGLRHLGTARTGAYYSVAPFFGAVLGLALGEPLTWQFVAAGLLMALGVWLHLTERHEHLHHHEALTHGHWHTHDDHHQHAHDGPVVLDAFGGHRHTHDHAELTHSHPHYPDSHHRHSH